MNFLSWVLLILILTAFGLAIWKLCRNKKQGCGGCSQGACAGCPMKGNCKGRKKE